MLGLILMSEPPAQNSETVLGLDPRALLGSMVRRRMPEPGGQLEDYQLVRRIAQGGMGTVYEARQVSLGRTVALKVISSGLLATDAEVQRFRREAEAAASLDHPGIVPIYEIGEDDGQHFFSMKLLPDGNLADLSRALSEATRGTTAWQRRAAELTAQMARAVEHAHRRGVLHRDVKPANVLLDESGKPHLTDFGLARLLERDSGMTMTLAVMGTPGYMAPEQAAGNTAQVGVAADIYSLGAVLYELLTGHKPFESASLTELNRQMQERDAYPLRRYFPGVARDLEIICLKCLRREPERRFLTAGELADDLDRWLAGKPIRARSAGPGERIWLWTRRNPLAAAAGVLLLALAAVSTFSAIRLRGQRNEISEALTHSRLAQAYAQRLGAAPDRRAQNLHLIGGIAPSLEARNEAIATLALPALGAAEVWYAPPLLPQIHERMMSADGARFAIFGQMEGITVYRRSDGAVLGELATPPGHLFTGKMSPDGRWLVGFDLKGTVFMWDVDAAGNGPRRPVWSVAGPFNSQPDFTPDSRALVLASQDKRVRFFNTADGTETGGFTVEFPPFVMRLSPPGDLLAYYDAAQFIVRSLTESRQVSSFTHTSGITALAWHPAGRRLAVGYRSGEMLLFDTSSQKSRWLTPHQQDVSSLAFDARGEILASSSWDSTQRYTDIATGRVLFDTRGAATLRATSGGNSFALLVDDGGIQARGLSRSPVLRTLSSEGVSEGGLSGVDFSPDGRWVVAGDFDGLHVWGLADGKERAFAPSKSAWRPRVHPDGKFIVTCGSGELLRWPLEAAADGAARLGPPERIAAEPGSSFSAVDFTPDGKWFSAPVRHGSLVLHWGDPAQRVVLDRTQRAGHDQMVISPDGNWVVGAEFGGTGVSVWNAHDGTKLRHLIEITNAALALSPDGTVLATATATELVLWDTATWQPRHRRQTGLSGTIPVPVAFSPDGRVLAAAMTRQDIMLCDVRTSEPFATLTAPMPLNLVTLRFSPDSRHLAAQTLGPVLHLWDLHALRRELQALGQDW